MDPCKTKQPVKKITLDGLDEPFFLEVTNEKGGPHIEFIVSIIGASFNMEGKPKVQIEIEAHLCDP